MKFGNDKFTDVTAKIVPAKEINFADFDFDLHLEKEYMGAESAKLVYEGAGKFNGADFTFSGPVNMLKLQYGLGTKWNAEMKYEANIFELKEYKFDVSTSSLKVEGAEVSEDEKKVLLGMLSDKVE
jgi:hypothetical protein